MLFGGVLDVLEDWVFEIDLLLGIGFAERVILELAIDFLDAEPEVLLDFHFDFFVKEIMGEEFFPADAELFVFLEHGGDKVFALFADDRFIWETERHVLDLLDEVDDGHCEPRGFAIEQFVVDDAE